MTTASTAPKTPRRTKKSTPTTPAAVESPSTNGNGRAGKKTGKLVIVESPAKARTVANILGDGYTVIASVGHVRDLPNYGYGLEDFENFKPKYVVVKDNRRGVDKNDVINEITAAAETADIVFLSTDPDREGEAIAWHIKEAAHIPDDKTSRVVFHEITKPAIEEAFEHPGALNMDLVDAQQTRRVLDRLIGFPLTWFVQGKVARNASAGRVQSVALRLIVDRERDIQQFVPREYWTIHALLGAQDGNAVRSFESELARLPGEKAKPSIESKDQSDALISAFERSAFRVASVKRGERKKSPAAPFTTSTFQQAASNRLGIGAQQAMSAAQQLYEGVTVPGVGPVGLITYMRTDSLSISPVARDEARQFVEGKWGKDYIPEKAREYKTRSKGAQEAHEAIRPTSVERTPESLRGVLDAQQMRVYTLIWQRFVASQMADARFTTRQVEIEAKEGDTLHGTFRASAQQLAFAGHLQAYGKHETEVVGEDEDAESNLPEIAEGQALNREKVDGRQHFTEPPPRFTEASLVKELEELGIGRPSTYASIVGTVQKRDYVKKEGRALVPQELGFVVNDLLVKHLDNYVEPQFTSRMEDQLDEIADGKNQYLPVVRDFWTRFEGDLERAKQSAEKQVEQTDFLCDVCGEANLVIRWGRNGQKFLGCPRYPECKNAKPLGADGKPVEQDAPQATGYECPIDGGALIGKTGPFGPYVDCENREAGTCDFRSSAPVGQECPECAEYGPRHGELVEKRTKRGVFYGCWNYPNCSYTTKTLEEGKLSPVRPLEEREEANKKLQERSARGKAAFAKRKSNARAKAKAS